MPDRSHLHILERVRFQIGEIVVERLREGENSPIEHSEVVEITGDVCKLSSGRFYDRLTGRGLPISDDYRAIHGLDYIHEVPR